MSDSIFLTDGNGTITGLTISRYYGSEHGFELIIPEYINGERITSIGDYALCDWNQRAGAIIGVSRTILPNSITSIGKYAFLYAEVGYIDIPDSVTTIGEGAFKDVYADHFSIPDSVVSIGPNAFYHYYGSHTIYVPDPNNLSSAVSSYDWTHGGLTSVTFAQTNIYKYYLIKNDALSGIADKVRTLSGITDTLTPAEMQNELSTFNADMSSIITNQDDIIAQIVVALDW